mmetsp:Transcript_117240/g.292360  ORF Transcript_117240/g.292360 Transcript_117240/m.292360 type:complete len:215 (+) Transcript_117240:527-1171(+)
MVMWPFPSRSKASKICRKCCVSSSPARQARAVTAAFWSMFSVWKCSIVSTTSSMMLASGNLFPLLSHGCSSATITSHRFSDFFLRSSASNVFASLETFLQDLSLKLTGSLRILFSNSSLVLPRKGYCPERMMYITTPALQASQRWSYCTGAVTSSGATLYGVPAALAIFVPRSKGQQSPKSINLILPTQPCWTGRANMMFSVLRSRKTKLASCK